MQVMYERCAGLDVHKKTVVACVVTPDGQETRTFSTMTIDLLGLSDWLLACSCTHVAMESTSDYWKPVFNMIEGTFEVLLVNAQHVKAVPGRKTDVKDAAWLAELLQHGPTGGTLRYDVICSISSRERLFSSHERPKRNESFNQVVIRVHPGYH
jgi:transposase